MSSSIDWNADGYIEMNPIILKQESFKTNTKLKKNKMETVSYRKDDEWLLCVACDEKFSKADMQAHKTSKTHFCNSQIITLKEMKDN